MKKIILQHLPPLLVSYLNMGNINENIGQFTLSKKYTEKENNLMLLRVVTEVNQVMQSYCTTSFKQLHWVFWTKFIFLSRSQDLIKRSVECCVFLSPILDQNMVFLWSSLAYECYDNKQACRAANIGGEARDWSLHRLHLVPLITTWFKQSPFNRAASHASTIHRHWLAPFFHNASFTIQGLIVPGL